MSRKAYKIILLIGIFLLINIFVVKFVYAEGNENELLRDEIANNLINRNR